MTFVITTEKDDDEALADFVLTMKRVAKEITGRELSPAESPRWGELAEVLATELKIAAGRTTVSSVPAFLAEHLRRRLWKKEKRQLDDETREATTTSAPKLDAAKWRSWQWLKSATVRINTVAGHCARCFIGDICEPASGINHNPHRSSTLG